MDYLQINELYHYGIKGQKWGIRKYRNEDGTLTQEGKEKYGSIAREYRLDQKKRDTDMYGRFAAKRIDKRTLEGDQVSGARSKEVGRINSFRRASGVVGIAGQVAGGIGGAIGGYIASKKVANLLLVKGYGNTKVPEVASYAVAAGSAAVGSILGKAAGESLTMLSGGYSPTKRNG